MAIPSRNCAAQLTVEQTNDRFELMFVVALLGCVVQGYGAKGNLRRGLLITILPMTVALSLALIADIDSPRGGIIHVQPQNLARLLQSLGK
jgi:hypothetical protein